MTCIKYINIVVLVGGTIGLAACTFDTRGISELGCVPHVPLAGEFASLEDLRLDADATIDTTEMSITSGGSVVTGSKEPADAPSDDWRARELVFDAHRQENADELEVAILHVNDFSIADGVEVRLIGERPIVIIAGGDVAIEGLLDAAARGAQPGPGGYGPGAMGGMGAGAAGTHEGICDTGGGGAGHAGPGADGGSSSGCGSQGVDIQGGSGGEAYGDYDDLSSSVLRGGSAGGVGGPGCSSVRAGAGGGAVQVYALGAIRIGNDAGDGGINAGGGGGEGGVFCPDGTGRGGGSGGGSGGVIFLQAVSIDVRGMLAANGGGGGGGGAWNRFGTANGGDAQLSTEAASGGLGAGGAFGTDGGSGGTDEPPTSGSSGDETSIYNTGGGGGAAGHIVFFTSKTTGVERTSPQVISLPECESPPCQQ